ncbi:hypothetical protein M501DRAFT_926239 [Patellaria atrata CBS 101060]|uniref:RRM domain-containing protein n=1 Tax=Patellaria atrata CBS 101060 TaxID=1346257 RepID=A0A9P4VVN6_9PEZI|nr:hypothetical protein M501DRAFT_926239 [Patellaria atrata CBS 101060]
MAGGPSPSKGSPPGLSNSSFLHGSFSSSSSSPQNHAYPPQQTMTADVLGSGPNGLGYGYTLSSIGDRKPLEKSTSSLLSFGELEPTISNPDVKSMPTILMRKLPQNTSDDTLRSMLLFAKDLIDVERIPSESAYPEDQGFSTAVARFKTLASAHEARDRLNGKTNAANNAKMIVDVWQHGISPTLGTRRNTIDGTSTGNRPGSTAAVSGVSTNGLSNRQSSRYNGTFQSMEKLSPPNVTPSLGNGDFPVREPNVHLSNLFSPKSPLNNSFNDAIRVSGKSMINDDAGDDETGELLKDPVAYAKNGQSAHVAMPRRTTNPQIPVSRFASLSLNTANGANGMASPPMPNYVSPRSVSSMQSPNSAMSPNTMPSSMASLGPNASYQLATQHFQRHNYPPVNPADQNPPCNTLYVGNLPLDTSEDELKQMFSKQRGYKRLCFRTKQNGPMCFVEFEDVSFATKALHELYGQPLHNSVKGGIRLSFSKNPLGVRTGQNSSMGPPTPLTSQAVMPGMSNGLGAPPGFSTATGPPPGLSAPPGLSSPVSLNGGSSFGMYSSAGFGMAGNGMGNLRSQNLGSVASSAAGGGFSGMGGSYSDYMMGR